jgi:hypothetical protein
VHKFIRRRSFGSLAGLFASIFVPSCAPSLPPFTEVEGTVTLDGSPLPGATIEFVPLLDHFPPRYNSRAVTDDQGHYRLVSDFNQTSGALATKHRVLVREQPIPDGMEQRSRENLLRIREWEKSLVNRPIPPAYGQFGQTPLTVEVKQGQSVYDLSLTRGNNR